MAVGERDLQGRIARNHAESVIGEMKVADDFGPKHAGDVRRSGSTAAGRDLLGDTAPADDVAAFFSDTTNGLVAKFNSYFVGTIGASSTSIANANVGGNLGTQETMLTNANTSIDKQIADIERRIAQERSSMQAAFQNMETAMSSMKSTQALLTSTYSTTSSTSNIGSAKSSSSSSSTSSTSSS